MPVKKEGKGMGLFGKKKNDASGMVITHYEGLPGFRQDFPCNMNITEDKIVFSNKEGSTVELAKAQVTNIDWMREDVFMGKYHNNPVSTAKGNAVKWFSVILYKSSGGEDKYIAFWEIGHKANDYLKQNVQIAPTNTVL